MKITRTDADGRLNFLLCKLHFIVEYFEKLLRVVSLRQLVENGLLNGIIAALQQGDAQLNALHEDGVVGIGHDQLHHQIAGALTVEVTLQILQSDLRPHHHLGARPKSGLRSGLFLFL